MPPITDFLGAQMVIGGFGGQPCQMSVPDHPHPLETKIIISSAWTQDPLGRHSPITGHNTSINRPERIIRPKDGE